MQHLQDIEAVGVALRSRLWQRSTAGGSDLVFLPCAGKLKIRIRERQVVQEMTLEAVLAILEGESASAGTAAGDYLPAGPSAA